MRSEITFQNFDEINQNPLLSPDISQQNNPHRPDYKLIILLILVAIVLFLFIISQLLPKKGTVFQKPTVTPSVTLAPTTVEYAMPSKYEDAFKIIDIENNLDPNLVPPQLRDDIGL